jgi:hypothetical protein
MLLGGVERSVPSTVAIFWPIVRPHLSSNTPDSSTSALWLHQRHIAVTQGGGEKHFTSKLPLKNYRKIESSINTFS